MTYETTPGGASLLEDRARKPYGKKRAPAGVSGEAFQAVLSHLGSPIAYYPKFASLAGGALPALFLSQSFYWSQRTDDPDGWFWKTGEEWERELGMTRSEQELARKKLLERGLIEEKREGLPARMFYRVNFDALADAANGAVSEGKTPEELAVMFAATLRALSATGYKRAVDARVEAVFVDYSEVLLRDQAVCGICNERVRFGPGSRSENMQFDHADALCDGGAHTLSNVRVTHAGCNLARRHGRQSPTNKIASVSQTGLPASSKPERPCLADIPYSESTSETSSLTDDPFDDEPTHVELFGTSGAPPAAAFAALPPLTERQSRAVAVLTELGTGTTRVPNGKEALMWRTLFSKGLTPAVAREVVLEVQERRKARGEVPTVGTTCYFDGELNRALADTTTPTTTAITPEQAREIAKRAMAAQIAYEQRDRSVPRR